MVSNKRHSIASSKITIYFSVSKIRLGKRQLSLVEEKLTLAKTISRTPDLQQLFRSKTQGGTAFPLLPSPVDSAHYSNKFNNRSFPLPLARSFVHPTSNHPLNRSSGVQVLQISTNCN